MPANTGADDAVRDLARRMRRALGARRRRRAAAELAALGTPEAAAELARALDGAVPGVAETAREGLTALVGADALDLVPTVGAATLAALHTGRPELLADTGAAGARALAGLATSGHRLAPRAAAAVAVLARPEAREAVCALAFAEDGDAAARLAVAADVTPADETRRALLLFLAGEHGRYAELDHDGALLTAAVRTADDSLRARLARQARAAGSVAWIDAVTGATARSLADLDDGEWDDVVAVLRASDDLPRVWATALVAPPVRAVALLRGLASCGWRPPAGDEHTLWDRLRGLLPRCGDGPGDGVVTVGTHPFPTELIAADDGLLVCGLGWLPPWRTDREPDGGPPARYDYDEELESRHSWVQLHDPAGSQRERPERTLYVRTIGEAFAADRRGRVVAAGGWPSPWVWNGDAAVVAEGERGGADCLALSPDGRRLAVSRAGRVRLYSMPPGRSTESVELEVTRDRLLYLAATPDGRRLVGLDKHGEVRLWRLDDGAALGGWSVGPLVPAHLGEALAEAQAAGDTRAVTRARKAYDDKVNAFSTPAALGADGTLLVVSVGEKRVQVHELDTGAPVAVVAANAGDVAVTPDGTLLVTAARHGGDVRLWRLPSGDPVGVVDAGSDGVVSTHVAAVSDTRVAVVRTHLLWPERSRVPVRVVDVPTRLLADLARRPVGRIDPAELAHCGTGPWADLVRTLVLWPRRFDVELDDPRPGVAPGPRDVELET